METCVCWYVQAPSLIANELVEVSREKPVHPLSSFRAPVRLGGAETELDRAFHMLSLDKFRVLVRGELIEDGSHEVLSVLSIGLHISHDHFHSDICGSLMPAVIVSGHANHLVGNLGLTSQLRLRKTRHVDDAATPGAVELTLGASGELRSLWEGSQQPIILIPVRTIRLGE